VEGYCRAGQAINYNIVQRLRFACWITKAADTHSECVILIAFHCVNGYMNAPQCYFIRTLPVLLFVSVTFSKDLLAVFVF